MFVRPVLCLTLICLLMANSVAMAQRRSLNLNQYKRIHQDALAKTIEGKPLVAIENLKKTLEKLPDDAESHYMMAVAQAKLGRKSAAVESVRKAIEAGLPASRFLTGTKTGLESIQSEPEFIEFRRMVEDPIPHGPMLGCITGTSVKIWVRTAGVRTVAAKVRKVGDDSDVVSDDVTTSKETDHSGVMTVGGLEANTEYTYHVIVKEDGKEVDSKAAGRFRTLSETGQPVKFRIAFGGGAGFVPQHEHMWDTIREEKPDVLMLLGDNVYSDAPKMPEMQHYCYYRRQSRPEYKKLTAITPTFTIWDDHDFGVNDCSGGPAIDEPIWKLPVYRVFRNNWVNPYYGGGDEQPGCHYDFYLGDVHFIMLDGRFYRNLKPSDDSIPTMLGPVQRKWLLEKIKGSKGKLLVLCSPVPWVYGAKGDSKDTWNGFKKERTEIFDFLTANKSEGVLLMSADRHRSDLWKIERPDDYPLYELNSSRLTNQHVHPEMKAAVFSYNKKQSFGTVDIDTIAENPTITYRIVSIDGEEIHKHTIKRSELVK